MEVPDRVVDCHLLLVRLAGRLPDELVAICRTWLGEGDLAAVVEVVAEAVLAEDVPLVAADLDLLRGLLDATDQDRAVLDGVDAVPDEPLPWYWFSDGPLPDHLDVDGAVPAEHLAEVAIAVVSVRPDVLGLWRAWRMPVGQWSITSKQIFVVEADGYGDLVSLTTELQDALAAAGQAEPQVEVYPVGAALPSYHRTARGYGQLLWAPALDRPLRVVPVYNGFPVGHPRIPDPVERDRIVAYLRQAQPILHTMATGVDVFEEQPVSAVPLTVRTDGTYIWAEAAGYYLERYDLAPDAALLAHIRERGYAPAPVDTLTAQRAIAVLLGPTDGEQQESVPDAGDKVDIGDVDEFIS